MPDPSEDKGPQRARPGEMLEAVKRLSPAERAELRALLNGPQRDQRPGTPRLSGALEAVPADEVPDVVKALQAGIKISESPDGGDSMKPVRETDPELAAALERNSNQRNKPAIHSVRVALQWFTERYPAPPPGKRPAGKQAAEHGPAAPAGK